MSDARVEKVYADRVGSGEFLAQAELFLTDADTASLRLPSRAILLHNATVCACDAILQAAGLRVTSGDGSHALRLETALKQVDLDTEELLERLDASRARRNEASYAAGFRGQGERGRCARGDCRGRRTCALVRRQLTTRRPRSRAAARDRR